MSSKNYIQTIPFYFFKNKKLFVLYNIYTLLESSGTASSFFLKNWIQTLLI